MQIGDADRVRAALSIGILGAIEHLDARTQEVQDVVVRVETVGVAPGHFHRPHIAYGVGLAPPLVGAPSAQRVVRRPEALHQLLRVVGARVRHGVGRVDEQAAGLGVHRDEPLQLLRAALHDPRRAHRTAPDAFARLQPPVMRALAVALVPDLDAAGELDTRRRHALPGLSRQQPAVAPLDACAASRCPGAGLRLERKPHDRGVFGGTETVSIDESRGVAVALNLKLDAGA